MRLNKAKVLSIKVDLAKRFTQSLVAKLHGVSRSIVSDIATGRYHKDVPWPDGVAPPAKKAGGQRKVVDYDPTDERIMELEAEIVHLTDERNRERLKVKAGAKIAGLFRAITKEMDQRIKPFTALPNAFKPRKKAEIVEHAVLHISDCHADQVVVPESVGGLEAYNFPVACRRAERLIDSTIEWTQETLAPKFRFPVLWVLAYGDFSSGTIHKAAERSYYRNEFRNCLAIGQLHGLMIRDLACYFEHVNCVYLSGNHGRLTPKKDFYGPTENFDYLVAEIARLHCKGLSNVSFLIPDAWSVCLDINGVGVQVSHGDEVRSNGGLPWYAMVRRQKGLIALNSMQGGLRTRYFVMGHHHVNASLADVDGELLVNGSWLGTDPFAFNALAGYREPCQLLHGMNARYGATWRLPIKLRSKGEGNGPRRYMIDRGREVGPA
jgi:hypothetical protein